MADDLKPHSPEWFAALERTNPAQGARTREALAQSGLCDGCSVCGDGPATDCVKVDPKPDAGMVATLRLCDDCRTVLIISRNETYAPV